MGRVRIIGGAWRSRLLAVPRVAGLRPTPDRVRETLFNWLGQELSGRICLDLFAGSGALGFEAASRGASRVVMVEANARAYARLKAHAAALGATQVELHRGDGLEFLARDTRCFDVVFLDPPYASGYLERVLPRLPPRLAPDAFVYAESPEPFDPGEDWEIWRQDRAGQVCYRLLKRRMAPPHD
ncbi:MAG: 16S rRNA (guanine(966)-N(2))-methyltransferase RsmD [Azospira oryzae]|nr:MAG: 16S rRNA (guanine(966)-N(2))-methyltransferase RsmD [Azospira oryzae]PZP79787.1 MAG: 16S rRNA (guanine(966)-N(2))-methyltransferase RsmD [Azospira oryzae]